MTSTPSNDECTTNEESVNNHSNLDSISSCDAIAFPDPSSYIDESTQDDCPSTNANILQEINKRDQHETIDEKVEYIHDYPIDTTAFSIEESSSSFVDSRAPDVESNKREFVVSMPQSNSSIDSSKVRHQSKEMTTSSTEKVSTLNFLSDKLSHRTRLTDTPIMRTSLNLKQGRSSEATNTVEDDVQRSSRRYKVGNHVLLQQVTSKGTSSLVNRYGFPPGEGESPGERTGPYTYILAIVKQTHFEESHPFYTVTRCDTSVDQRADWNMMEPIRTSRARMAALRASKVYTNGISHGTIASQHNTSTRSRQAPQNKIATCLQVCCYYLLLPFLWIFDCFDYIWVIFLSGLYHWCIDLLKRQAHLFLYGDNSYVCAIRLTAINFVVLCSTWFMFMDQARLAFFPPSADFAFAAVSLVVWCVLVLELLFQVFIRPDGYYMLIISEKAFAPSTKRYINFFHLVVEFFSLAIYIPEFYCLFNGQSCGTAFIFSFYSAAKLGVIGPTLMDIFLSHAFVALIRLRVFCVVRYWRNFWIVNTFLKMKWKPKQSGFLLNNDTSGHNGRNEMKSESLESASAKEYELNKREESLTNASNIGTALMATNSYRALACAWAVMGLFPLVFLVAKAQRNQVATLMTDHLQAINILASDSTPESCNFLVESTHAWISSLIPTNSEDIPYLLSVEIEPYRCLFDGRAFANVRICESVQKEDKEIITDPAAKSCKAWSEYEVTDSNEVMAEIGGIRQGSILEISRSNAGIFTSDSGANANAQFFVRVRFDQTSAIRIFAFCSVLLQLCLLLTVLGGLSILRKDAELLVLWPLRRMLKIVARYARNPLIPQKVSRNFGRSLSGRLSGRSEDTDSSSEESFDDEEHVLGSFETEQLITAVAKITDLLRKCWGVAGADIISTNLATREGTLTEVFNPTVPGQSVYALFAFAAIGGFDNALRNLGGDVMPLINDVAAVLHGEVFRWGLGDSGQCNKNLGGAFLMVFRIGLVREVIEKLEQATGVVFGSVSRKTSNVSALVKRRKNQSFSTAPPNASYNNTSTLSGSLHNRSNAKRTISKNNRRMSDQDSINPMSLSLHSLPGISTFTDRAVIGMLKSYAGIYRDKQVLSWNEDFRLGVGVRAFNISMIFGMDAGWAIEGAVGSEYKIDATYLSPHVNMASRMTSACKQYEVVIMLSQAVQELMSDVAQSKLRHLDTVSVRGSSVKQKIYTYDAKARGVDFFLYSKTEEQADVDADRYSNDIWNRDRDLLAMRQHISDDFLQIFKEGFKAYTNGDWPRAIESFHVANNITFQTAVDEGFLEEEFDALNLRAGTDVRHAAEKLKRENRDGPSTYLINFMKSYGGVAPLDWDGWHPLTRK